jgi:hypothetical protein
MNGSFLAVNQRGSGFDSGDMLLFLEGYSPTSATPVTLL